MKTRHAMILLGIVWLIAAVFLEAIAQAAAHMPAAMLDLAVMSTCVLCGALVGVFLPIPSQDRLNEEIKWGVWAGLGVMGVGLVNILFFQSTPGFPGLRFALLLLGFSLAGSLPAYAMLRLVQWGWPRWHELTQTRFLWAQTRVHQGLTVVLTLVILGLALVALLTRGDSALPTLSQSGMPLWVDAALQGVSWLIFFCVLVVFSLLVSTPTTAIFSFWVARRQSKRLNNLNQAAKAVLDGQLEARVYVEGRDDLSGLQTDFNRIAAQLEETAQALKAERGRTAELLKVQRNLTANISHDLRTPLSILRGFLETRLDSFDSELPTGLRADLEIMDHEVERLERLVQDLSTLSQAQSEQLILAPAAVDAEATIQNVALAAAPLAWQIGRVKVVTEPLAAALQVRADPARLEEALQNLVQNSVRHTPPGGFVSLSAQEDGDAVLFEVRDSGELIQAEDLARVWEHYFSQAGASKRSSGLGLAIVKELTSGMGGRVDATSQQGEGNTFSIWLPGTAREPDATQE